MRFAVWFGACSHSKGNKFTFDTSLCASGESGYRRGGFSNLAIYLGRKKLGKVNYKISILLRGLQLAYLQMYGTNGVKGNLIMGNYCNVHENTHLLKRHGNQ